MNLGRWDRGQHHFEQALTLIGLPLPGPEWRWRAGLCSQLLTQCARRIAPNRSPAASTETTELMREALCAYARVGAISTFHDRLAHTVYCLVAALNLGERIGPTPEFAIVCVDVGNTLGLVVRHAFARPYYRLADRAARDLRDSLVAARVRARSCATRIGIGDWSIGDDLEAAMAACDQIGDSYLWEDIAGNRSRMAHLRGDFQLAARLGAELKTRANSAGSLAHEIWGIDAEAWGVLFQGRSDMALELANRGLLLAGAAPRTPPFALPDLLGVKALALLDRGDLDAARESAERVMKVMDETGRPRFFADLYLWAACEVFLAIWENERSGSRSAVAHQAESVCGHIRRYARINPVARARAFLAQGSAEWLRGRHERAFRTWRRSLVEAERFGLPYEAARVHYEVGRHLSPSDPAHTEHLAKAEAVFSNLNAAIDVRRVTNAKSVGRLI